jgi:hypothetical protein
MKGIFKLRIWFFFFLFGLILNGHGPEARSEIPRSAVIPAQKFRLEPAADFGKIPLYFIPNRGQADEEALFYARTPGYTLWVTRGGLVFDCLKSRSRGDLPGRPVTVPGSRRLKKMSREVSRLMFIGSNREVPVVAVEPASHRVNVLRGDNPAGWKAGISTSLAVVYRELYPGIDLKVYGVSGRVEYDWIVRPGGDPGRIRFGFRGAGRTALNREGDLKTGTGFGKLIHRKPSGYQLVDGKKKGIETGFRRVKKGEYGIRTGRYDRSRTLVIDPLVLVYSTYLGGGNSDSAQDIAVDGSGCAYVCGTTWSVNFPQQNSYTMDPGDDSYDVFVTKLSAEGSSLVYSTYLGGNNMDFGLSIAVDSEGSAYMTGCTYSTDFPVLNAFQTGHAGGNEDVFVTKLSADGSSLVYSTYLGGDGYDYGNGIAVDGSDCAYVTGHTYSTDFPVMNAYQTALGGIPYDAFVTKLSPSGSSLVYSTYLGGEVGEEGRDIAVDGSGSAYVTGWTASTDFPTVHGYMTDPDGNGWDVFITKLSPDGNSLAYSTYLGGGSEDVGWGIAVDGSGCAYVCGSTWSVNFPTVNPYMTDPGDNHEDVFVTKLSAEGSSLVYSTYLGGGSNEIGYSIAVDGSGSAYVTGKTLSTDFPVLNPYMNDPDGNGWDGFVTKLSADGSFLVYSTYLGGGSTDVGYGIAVDGSGSAFVTGYTLSTDFPTVNPYMNDPGDGSFDAFVTKLTYLAGAGQFLVSGTVRLEDGTPLPGIRIGFSNNGGSAWTDGTGHYGLYLERYWSGRAIPESLSYVFTPAYRDYYSLDANRPDQDYTAGWTIQIHMEATRERENAWTLVKDYGKITFLKIADHSDYDYLIYIIYRRKEGGDYEIVKEILSSDLTSDSYTFLDKYLDQDSGYTYFCGAVTLNSVMIGKSEEITI